MKTNVAVLTLFLTAAVWANSAFAVVDFETDPLGGTPTDDGLVLGTFTDSGVQITFGFDGDNNGSVETPAVFEQVGTYQFEGTNIGFQGSDGTDTADAGLEGQLGNWFLRGSTFGAPFGRFVIQYSSPFPVTAASGEIWDIDGRLPVGPETEQYKVEAFDSFNTSLGVIFSPIGTHMTNEPLAFLDGRPWVFSFSGILGDIDRIDITFIGTKTSGIGLAFNNFYPTTAVPEPSIFGLIGVAGCISLIMRNRDASRSA